MFILREPSGRWKEVHDEVLVIPSGDVGPPTIKSMEGEACGTMKRLRARFPFRKWVSGSGEFTDSW